MTVKESNTRLILTMPKEVKTKLEQLAEKENRSLSNMINTIILQYLESIGEK